MLRSKVTLIEVVSIIVSINAQKAQDIKSQVCVQMHKFDI